LYQASNLSFHLGKSLSLSQQWFNVNGCFSTSLKCWGSVQITKKIIAYNPKLPKICLRVML
jgi:hypothetical protein